MLKKFQEKGSTLRQQVGRPLLSLKTIFKEVQDQIIFIAENGSVVEFHGEDVYEATMSPDFYQALLPSYKKVLISIKISAC